MTQYKKLLGALTIVGALAAGSTAFAQTASTTTTVTTDPTMTTTDATTPTAPNTGAGGDAAQNYALLAVSALVAIGGAVYLSRKNATV